MRWLALVWIAVTVTWLAAAPALPVSSTALADESWIAGPDAVGASTYLGAIDGPQPNESVVIGRPLHISGWVVDTTAQGWTGIDEVRVYLGQMDAGGTLLSRATIGLSRPDIASKIGVPVFVASGFAADVSTAALAEGPTTLSLYAH